MTQDLGARRITQLDGRGEHIVTRSHSQRSPDDGFDGEPARQALAIAQHRTSAAQSQRNKRSACGNGDLKRPKVKGPQAAGTRKRAFGEDDDGASAGERVLHPLHLEQTLFRRGTLHEDNA